MVPIAPGTGRHPSGNKHLDLLGVQADCLASQAAWFMPIHDRLKGGSLEPHKLRFLLDGCLAQISGIPGRQAANPLYRDADHIMKVPPAH
jgi:hypothetical protein